MERTKRPKGMSQLDYLWTQFGNYAMQNGTTNPQYAILTEDQINQKLYDMSVYWEEDDEES